MCTEARRSQHDHGGLRGGRETSGNPGHVDRRRPNVSREAEEVAHTQSLRFRRPAKLAPVPLYASRRRRGGIEPLHVSMPRELKSRPSTSPTHPGTCHASGRPNKMVGRHESWLSCGSHGPVLVKRVSSSSPAVHGRAPKIIESPSSNAAWQKV